MSLVRPVFAVATLSVFLVPITTEFGWSRGLFSGAVSLGGIAAAVVSPFVGRMLDRVGAGPVLAVSSLAVGICALTLPLVSGPLLFYIVYVVGRMTFAGPLELGPSTAVSNWFIRKRAVTMAWVQASQGAGLALIPFVAQSLITGWSWQTAWTVLGAMVLAIGVFPPALMMVRRPEDVGLSPDGGSMPIGRSASVGRTSARATTSEQDSTLLEALHTPAMWLLMVFSALVFMVQAGVSLHQAPYYIQRGLSPGLAASVVSVFAFSSAVGGLAWSALVPWLSLRLVASMSAAAMFCGVLLMMWAQTAVAGWSAAIVFGLGLGGVQALIRVVWADYYGRTSLGTIRGVALPVQVSGQAAGPLIAGAMFDFTGSYRVPLSVFAVAAGLSAGVMLAARPPRRRSRGIGPASQ